MAIKGAVMILVLMASNIAKGESWGSNGVQESNG